MIANLQTNEIPKLMAKLSIQISGYNEIGNEIDVSKEHVFVDVGASESFEHYSIGKLFCPTASRCKGRAIHISSRGRNIKLKELSRFMGINPSLFSLTKAKVKKSTFGEALGNTICVPMLIQVLPRLLHAAGVVDGIPPLGADLRRPETMRMILGHTRQPS